MRENERERGGGGQADIDLCASVSYIGFARTVGEAAHANLTIELERPHAHNKSASAISLINSLTQE